MRPCMGLKKVSLLEERCTGWVGVMNYVAEVFLGVQVYEIVNTNYVSKSLRGCLLRV
jgi:hypothetical protein